MPDKDQNPMRKLKIGKVVVNMAVGTSGEKLAKAATVLDMLTGQKPSFRKAKKTIKVFGIRKGENIACVVTLMKDKAVEFLKKALEAVDYKIKRSSFDEYGNFSFGIKEHISLPGVKYDPMLGIFGFDVCVTIERPGYRVMKRRRKKSDIGKNHRVTREESIKFVQEFLGVKIV
ncbi:MAG: 50S ribosomal protein L5 [Candidatus Nezhaarchaeales archaeon]